MNLEAAVAIVVVSLVAATLLAPLVAGICAEEQFTQDDLLVALLLWLVLAFWYVTFPVLILYGFGRLLRRIAGGKEERT